MRYEVRGVIKWKECIIFYKEDGFIEKGGNEVDVIIKIFRSDRKVTGSLS